LTAFAVFECKKQEQNYFVVKYIVYGAGGAVEMTGKD